MNFSKLGPNEKLAAIGAIASIVGPILATYGFGFGAGGLTLILALAMLAIVFLPQFSPGTQLPGSKGSLMVIVGGIAAASAALALLGSIGYLGYFGSNLLSVLGWLIGIGGGLLMGWAGWQEFQSEGGKLQLGSSGAAAPRPPVAPYQPPAASSAPPPAAPPPIRATTPPELEPRLSRRSVRRHAVRGEPPGPPHPPGRLIGARRQRRAPARRPLHPPPRTVPEGALHRARSWPGGAPAHRYLHAWQPAPRAARAAPPRSRRWPGSAGRRPSRPRSAGRPPPADDEQIAVLGTEREPDPVPLIADPPDRARDRHHQLMILVIRWTRPVSRPPGWRAAPRSCGWAPRRRSGCAPWGSPAAPCARCGAPWQASPRAG